VKWVSKGYYRKRLRRDYREMKKEWHQLYAWWPRRVPEHKAKSIVVPCHYVWLEYVDRKRNPSPFWIAAAFDPDARRWVYRAACEDTPRLERKALLNGMAL
jgi:hypothetical protein